MSVWFAGILTRWSSAVDRRRQIRIFENVMGMQRHSTGHHHIIDGSLTLKDVWKIQNLDRVVRIEFLQGHAPKECAEIELIAVRTSRC